jgi:hypothetical protein
MLLELRAFFYLLRKFLSIFFILEDQSVLSWMRTQIDTGYGHVHQAQPQTWTGHAHGNKHQTRT